VKCFEVGIEKQAKISKLAEIVHTFKPYDITDMLNAIYKKKCSDLILHSFLHCTKMDRYVWSIGHQATIRTKHCT